MKIRFIIVLTLLCIIFFRIYYSYQAARLDGALDKTEDLLVPEITAGNDLYDRHCLACHQNNGSGKSQISPSLNANPRVAGEINDLIKTVLFGIDNKNVDMNGNEYIQSMPELDHLSDKEIAEILTFIRSSWKNNAPPVLTSDVARVRQEGRTKTWRASF